MIDCHAHLADESLDDDRSLVRQPAGAWCRLHRRIHSVPTGTIPHSDRESGAIRKHYGPTEKVGQILSNLRSQVSHLQMPPAIKPEMMRS